MLEKLQNIRLSPIKQFELLASKIPDVVSLAQGIPSFDTPEFIKDRVIEILNSGKASRYSLTPGLPQLRESISENLERYGIYYDYEYEIICTCGSIEAITATLMTILEPGDEVILLSPSYASYQEAVKIAGGRPVFIPLIEEKGWSLDLNLFEKVINKKTKAILYCNPNNPTGTIYTKEELLELAKLAIKNDLYIIADEVYKDFIYTEQKFYTLAQSKRFRKRLIYIFSFSKAYAMTGWRIGFLCTYHELAREILKIHDSLVTCAPVISQYAAIAALEEGSSSIRLFYDIFLSRRNLILKRLEKFKKVFSYQTPNSSYFVFPKILIEYKNSWDFAIDILNKAKVALVPGSAFGPTGEGHLRICFGRSEEDINLAFDRLEKYFNIST